MLIFWLKESDLWIKQVVYCDFFNRSVDLILGILKERNLKNFLGWALFLL